MGITRTGKLMIFVLAVCFLSSGSVQARSGCCSHHGGVCGCGCCDGSDLSATCAPYYPECGSGSTSVKAETEDMYVPQASSPAAEPAQSAQPSAVSDSAPAQDNGADKQTADAQTAEAAVTNGGQVAAASIIADAVPGSGDTDSGQGSAGLASIATLVVGAILGYFYRGRKNMN